MNKKYYSLSLFLLVLLLIILINNNAKPNYSPEKTGTNQINNNDIDNHQQDESSLYDKLVFDREAQILNIGQNDNEYLAYGSKNGYPYFQPLELVDNQLKLNEKSMDYQIIPGTITNITSNNYYLTASIENEDNTTNQDFFISTDKIIPFYKKQINLNYSQGIKSTPTYIVIHETANFAVGADADAHYRYWNTNSSANASTHFVVDNKQIYQMLELNQVAWHVGDNKGYSDITNYNSIGIEIAVNADGNYEEARQNAIELTIKLMKSLNMNISQLKRHHDASGKSCPAAMLDNPSLWNDFINQVKKGLEK